MFDNLCCSNLVMAKIANLVKLVSFFLVMDMPELHLHLMTNISKLDHAGDLQLYPVSVKTQTGEKLELQVR